METWVKLVITFGVIVGDAIGIALVAPRMIREGKTSTLGIVGGSCLLTTLIMVYVLFAVVE